MITLFAFCVLAAPLQTPSTAFEVASVKLNRSNSRNSGIPPIRHSHIEGMRATMPELCDVISALMTRIVQDNTGLKGRYDFKLDWTPDELQSKGNENPNMTAEEGGASIFSAVQEQRGLKLESKRGPVSVLVIDGVRQPTEN